jgi:MFS family permease
MVSSALAAALARRNVHYGWVVVAVTFLTMLVTAGAMGAPGVLIVPLEREFGWDNTQISSALGLRLLLFGVFGPFAAAFMNRFGLRRVMICASALVVVGFLASLAMTRVWQLVLLWGVVIGVGTGLTAIVLAATVAARWFTQRRGLVVGLLSASSATGQLVFLPLIADLTDRFGWRAALVFVCGLLAAAALAALALMRDRPSDLKLPPYGESTVLPPPPAGVGLASLLIAPLEVLRDAARVPLFWVLFGTFFICGLSTNGLIQTHFITLCGDYGLTPVSAASVLAMMGVFDFIGTIGSGWLADRFDKQSLAVVMVLRATRAFAALSAVHEFHVLRLVAVRRVLWPRLDCDCSTHGEAHRRPLRTRARRDGVWLGLCRSSDRRSDRGFRCRLFAHGICELPARFLRRRGDVPHRGDAGADDRQAVIGGFRRGVAGASTRLGYFRFASIFSHPITS